MKKLKRIWKILPKRFQGFIFGIFVVFVAMLSSEVLNLIHTNIWYIDFTVALFYTFMMLKIFWLFYPWMTKEFH